MGICTDGLPIALSGAGLASPNSATCNNGQFSVDITFSNGDGVKNIIASQTDNAGNTGSDNRNFIKDTTAPNLLITGPAAGTPTKSTIQVVGTCETGLPVQLAGEITQAVTTDCTNGGFSVLVTLASPDGDKTVTAVQTDRAGNSKNDQRTFRLMTVAPAITITQPAANTVTRTNLDLQGTCTNGLPVQISGGIQTPTTATCANGQFSANITLASPDGIKNVVASQTDSVGNTGSDSRNFILDTTAPVVRFTSPAAGTVAKDGLNVTGVCESGLPVQLAGAGIGTPGPVSCNNGTFSANISFSAGDGVKTITASQTDAAGNTGSDSRDFNRDTTGPAITIASPAANTITNGSLTISGTCETGLLVQLSGQITPAIANCTNGQWSASVQFLAPDGSKNVIASQTDNVGNTGSDNRNFMLDTTAPSIKITSPATGTSTQSGLTISGTCESGLDVTLSGAITQSVTTSCTLGSFSANVTLSAPDGNKTVVASQMDSAGNQASDSRTFHRDTTAPLVRFTDPQEGSSAQTGLEVFGQCETGLPVELSGAGLSTPLTVNCSGGTFSAQITFSAGDGTKNIIAKQTDAAGNTGSDSRNFVKDATGPSIQILTPLAGAITNSGFTLTGTCETGLTVHLSGNGLSSPLTTSCANGKFSTNITLAQPDGTKTIVASQTDNSGNTASDSRDFVLDTTPPNVKITSPANGSAVNGDFTLTGTCEAGLALHITGDIMNDSTTTCPAGGNFSVDLTVSKGNGGKKVRAEQTDLAGNTGFDQANYHSSPKPSATETFIADQGEGKVDILFIDDNSASMDPEQEALGQKFPSFVSELAGLNWQIGITTTDCTSVNYGICGSLLTMTGTGSKVLTPDIPGYDVVFNNTIVRPETIGCAARGDCPSGLEEAMKATVTAIDKRNGINAGFFREDAALAVVVLSDEDEQSDGTPSGATKPQAVVDKVIEAFGAEKKFKAYAIVILPGDSSCLKRQADQQNGIAFYGTYATQLASLTGGQSVSICAPDYSVTLRQIGQDLRKLTQAVEISRTPIPGTVQVTFTPSQNINWTLQGTTILFDQPVAAGTRIDVTYQYER